MKIILPLAYVGAVTNLMLSHGSGEDATLVPATAVQFKAEVDPKILDELRPGLRDKFFEEGNPRVPSIPELDVMGWKTEYEGSTLTIDLGEVDDLDFEVPESGELRFTGVDAKAITFEPLATGMVAFKLNAIVQTDKEGRGQLAALLKHTVKATFSKLAQKPLMEADSPKDGASSAQAALPIGDAPPTTDGQPIIPLVH